MNELGLPERPLAVGSQWCRRLLGAFALATLAALPAAAQRTRARGDSVPLRADYRNIAELMDKLPKTAPPAFGQAEAVALGAVQISCLDRLQPPFPPRPNERQAADEGDSTVAADSAAAHGGGPAADSGAAHANDRGEGYFWVTSYSLVPNNNQTRAFWGCADWHSAVSSTWAAAYLVHNYPRFSLQDIAREKLADHLGASNLNGELAFFHAAAASINPIPYSGQRGLFERPYGFAWLLKLQSELYTWPDSAARKWARDVAPLAHWMADSLGAYLTALPVAARTGSQTNTALSMGLALDYAKTVGDAPLREQVVSNARRFYLGDKACKTESEAAAGRSRRGASGGRRPGGPRASRENGAAADTGVNDLSAPGAAAPPPRGFGGGDVVSPCLTEAALMARVLAPSAFVKWLDAFLPPLQSGRFAPLTEPAGGTGRVAPAERARLSGLSFQRARAMEQIAHALPASDTRVAALHRLSAIHAQRGFDLMRGDVSGVSWLPAYALLYVEARGKQ